MGKSGDTTSNILLPGLSLGSNAMGLMKANRDVKNAQGMVIPSTDWRQQEAYESLKDKARSLETGAAYAPQRSSLTQGGLSAINAIKGVTGGDIGSTVSAIQSTQRGTGRLMNELYGGMSQEGIQLQSLLASTAQNMANRSLNIDVAKQQQALGDAMKRKQQYQQNLTSAMTDVFGGGLVGDKFGGNTENKSSSGSSLGEGINLGGAASGAVSGATAGSVVPGVGTLLGGIIGGIGGLFKGK